MTNYLYLLFKKKTDEEIKEILRCNEISKQYGLELSEDEAALLVQKRYEVLKETKRRDYGSWIIDQIIEEFCKSEFITKDNYAKTIGELMFLFYHYKNMTKNMVGDDDLLKFMRKFYDGKCRGSLEDLSENILDRMAKNVNEGKPMNFGIENTGEIDIQE